MVGVGGEMRVFILKQVAHIVTAVRNSQELRSFHLLRRPVAVGLILFGGAELK
jgi:hypothetical protein